MKNSKALMYVLGIVGSVVAMLIHIRIMIDTGSLIHFMCFWLWFIICSGLIILFRHELENNKD
jgi:hypothetical protein